ncbi:uncharacterized protein LOC131941593 [Physella acuta]|uniref:uncharacterized protein LOC131941593 n=1 Tax=Physella acuta TaxID=109671 RepID=UPI0027DE52AE|nr:uncharacterized protein LOC131941593 [Physella acuta]XP_059156893.1 uncharacterized protein LOC131941593 [Physella acuta]
MIALVVLMSVSACFAAPSSVRSRKQDSSVDPALYGEPLTHEQIMQLIKDHTSTKRQGLNPDLYGQPLTTEQIMQLIKDHTGAKRQTLSLFGDPLTHNQIMDLISSHVAQKKNIFSFAHDPVHLTLSYIHTFLSLAYQDQPAMLSSLDHLSYDELLHLLGELMKGH